MPGPGTHPAGKPPLDETVPGPRGRVPADWAEILQPGGLNLLLAVLSAQTDHGVDAVAAAERSERVVVDHYPLLRSTDEPHATKATGAPS